MKFVTWRSTICVGVLWFVFSSSVFGADASFSFAPAPANLSGKLNASKLGVDVVNVSIDGGSSISATTFRYLHKSGQEKEQSDKKSVQGFSFYLTTMQSDLFDSASALGMQFDGVSGSSSGAAFIFSTGADIQMFSTTYGIATTDIVSLLWHLDLGLQTHMVLGPNLTLIPWGKFAYYNVNTTVSVETPYSYDFYDSNTNFSSMSYGADLMLNGFSLGAMYQQADGASVTKFSVSYDF